MNANISLQELSVKLNGKFWSKEEKERVYLDEGYNTKKMSTTTYVEIVDGEFVVKCYVTCSNNRTYEKGESEKNY